MRVQRELQVPSALLGKDPQARQRARQVPNDRRVDAIADLCVVCWVPSAPLEFSLEYPLE